MEGGKPLSADVDYRGPMWHQLEFETWQHWPKIGKNFMVKFSVVEEGYAVVMCGKLMLFFIFKKFNSQF